MIKKIVCNTLHNKQDMEVSIDRQMNKERQYMEYYSV